MKICFSGPKLLFISLLAVLLPASRAFAAGATVDCSGATPGAFTTITAALASLPAAGPNSISVTGTCHENVVMFGRTDLTIFGNPTATVVPGNANGRLLAIFGSQRIGIQNITFDGGRGAIVNDNSRVDLTSVTIQNSLGIGLTSIDSLVHIADSTIKNSTRSGISVGGGTFYVDSDVTGTTVTNNGRVGIAVATGHLILNGGDGVTPGTENVISNNGSVGVSVANSAEADISGDNRIIGNQGAFGLEVIHTSTVIMSDGTISSNAGVGVHCGETSHCEWAGVTKIDSNGKGGIEITDHSDGYLDGGIDISGNTGVGVLVDLSSVLNSLGGNTINNNTDDGVVLNTLSVLKFAANDTITGNGKMALECNNNSMVSGDISTYKPKKCGAAFQASPID
ncbi:MAG TPA: right-handed parallel beta-helix repeat-containing protein [Candidatus Angelobacter sp.]|nr:right-handed parallel beta-helix repeat-containing protein [Candidatus Angelobacter sp.]